MKKNILALGVLAGMLSVNAQSLTYVGDASKVYVANDAGFYSGGDWKVQQNANDAAVVNHGGVTIVGNYTSVGTTNTGAEFISRYTNPTTYGQVKFLKGTSNGTTGKMGMERNEADNNISNYYAGTYPIAFPYQDGVDYVITQLGGKFLGGVDRYSKDTFTKWNNNKLQHGVVLPSAKFVAGDYYAMNLKPDEMKTLINGLETYRGTPNPDSYTAKAKGVIRGMDEAKFNNATYAEWKYLRNSYNEKYVSYLGEGINTSKFYGKNTYRFGNPYTSNLDLSGITGDKNWLKILNNITYATDLKSANNTVVRNVQVKKRMATYNTNWDSNKGGSYASNGQNYFIATLDAQGAWTGSANALILKPFETFVLYFPLINTGTSGTQGSRLLNVQVDFNDNHKTFSNSPSAADLLGSTLTTNALVSNGVVTNGSLANQSASSRFVNNTTNFYQLDIALLQGEEVIASPVYLAGANYKKESGSVGTVENKIVVYGVSSDNVAEKSEKEINEFNSTTYIAKPLGLGFKGLVNGQSYALDFKLSEGSIFNKVKNLSTGDKFYIVDNKTNTAKEVKVGELYTFVADDTQNRFTIYWKQLPEGVKVGDTLEDGELVVAMSSSTIVYKADNVYRVRFERPNDKAKVEIYDLSGRLISSQSNVSTSDDYTLNFGDRAVYLINVTYQNGDVRTLKAIN